MESGNDNHKQNRTKTKMKIQKTDQWLTEQGAASGGWLGEVRERGWLQPWIIAGDHSVVYTHIEL